MAPLKHGGGQNVGLNFLIGLEAYKSNHLFVFVVARDSLIHKKLAKSGSYSFFVAPRNPLIRTCWELTYLSWMLLFLHVDIIYSYFGFSVVLSNKPQVTGSADSNIYFPEIDFWCDYSPLQKIKRKFIDCYRILILRLAAAVVFENQSLLKRGGTLYGLKNVAYIKPSVAELDDERADDIKNYPVVNEDTFTVLLLCGWQLNKNIMLVPAIASELKKRGYSISFVMTAPLDNSTYQKRFNHLVSKYDVSDCVFVVGTVRKSQLSFLYSNIDCVLLLSKLESFSNNIIESWFYKRPLLVADEEWSHSLCQDAAIYVDRDSVGDIAEKIALLSSNPTQYGSIVNAGVKLLSTYPTVVERTALEISYLEKVFDKK